MHRIVGLFLVILLSGCTSLHTEYLPGPDLPIARGDDIVLRPKSTGPAAEAKSLRVTSVDAGSISGRSKTDGGATLTYHWDDIRSIEYRQFDAAKTSVLVVVGVLFVASAIKFGEGFSDFWESIFGSGK